MVVFIRLKEIKTMRKSVLLQYVFLVVFLYCKKTAAKGGMNRLNEKEYE